MDRNTVIGLVLIGTLLTVFTIFNSPSEEELAKRKKETKQKEQLDKKEAESNEDAIAQKKQITTDSTWVAKLDSTGKQITKDSGLVYTNKATGEDSIFVQENKVTTDKIIEGEILFAETDKFKLKFNTKGGILAEVALKDYETYFNYAKNDGKITPLQLFKNGDAVNQLIIPIKGKSVKTGDLLFTLSEKTPNRIVFSADLGEGKKVKQIYALKDNAFDLDYTIQLEGFAGDVNPNNIRFEWDVAFRKSERLFSEQRRVSTVCYNYKEEGFSYLSEMGADEEEAEDDIEWIAYKQSYFSSILKPAVPFKKTGSTMKVDTYKEGEERNWTHLKDYSSLLNLNISDAGNASVSMNWYFGPNDYEMLRSYKSGYDDILNFGWGLFRWINVYAVQPLFNFLSSFNAISVGMAILLLTLILKIVLMPIQWKMFTSSAKMKILKPEIDELNAKYPNKEDAMKKQMEMMSLYRESGASPLAGCVPMLIQMPILLAVFRFFPASFELRQKSFLWAEDLSSYDSIYDFGTYIWPYGDHVSLFTLLMAATTLIYTILNSNQMATPQQPGMPNMKVIMYIFPIMMIFFFNNYSSGLSYYYFISTLVTIVLMFMIKRFFVDEERLKAKMAERKASSSDKSPKKKSKFQERLETMQKMQQEQMKKRKK